MVHKVQLTLSVEVVSNESDIAIEERINSVNAETIIDAIEETLDEVGVVRNIEII